MFLNDEYISGTFFKEGLSAQGQRENILVVKMLEEPDALKSKNPKEYKALSKKLEYINDLAKEGFFDFNRIEITTTRTIN